MGNVVSINGKIVGPEDAVVSVYDRGFLYGDAVFETVRTYGGRPFALTDHLDRLERSAERVMIPLPVDKATLEAETRAAIAAADNEESYARIMLTRGRGPMGLDPTNVFEQTRVVLAQPLTPPAAELYENGVGVILVQTSRAGDAADGGAKVANYLSSVLALKRAKDVDAHEALIVNRKGNVAEGTTSNVFIVKDGVLVTPPISAGILPGITRHYLLETARAEQIAVLEAPLEPAALLAADEAFISSSIREVLPVVRVSQAAGSTGKAGVIGDGRPGPITRRLWQAFRQRAAQLAAK